MARGALPPGMGLDPVTGTLTGWPTALGEYAFTFAVIDANGDITLTAPLQITVGTLGALDKIRITTQGNLRITR